MANNKPSFKLEKFSGLDNINSETTIPANVLKVADNIDITRNNQLKRRNGFQKTLSSCATAAWGDDGIFLFISEGNLCRLSNDFLSKITLKQDLFENQFLTGKRYQDKVYWSNNNEIGYIKNDVSYSIGLPTPQHPTISQVVGYMPSGKYLLSFTFLTKEGLESPPSNFAVIDLPDGSGLYFSNFIVPSDGRIDKVVVYLSTTNGQVLYRALILNKDVQTATYKGDAGKLNYQLRTLYLQPIPSGHIIRLFRGHLIVAQNNTIYFSNPYNLEFYNPLSNFVSLEDRITNLEPTLEGVFVTTYSASYFLAGRVPSEWQLVKLREHGGITGTMQVVSTENFGSQPLDGGQAVVWATEKGLVVGTEQGQTINLTSKFFNFPKSINGASVFVSKDENHLIFSIGASVFEKRSRILSEDNSRILLDDGCNFLLSEQVF